MEYSFKDVIIENDRDQRAFDYLKEHYSDDQILEAMKEIRAKNHRFFVSNLAKALNCKVPNSLARTPTSVARSHLETISKVIKSKKIK